jgi:hypothetical protein
MTSATCQRHTFPPPGFAACCASWARTFGTPAAAGAFPWLWWRIVATEVDAKPAEISRMASAFEHDDLTRAKAL